MQVEFKFSHHVFTATLYDNPTARDFVSLLPAELNVTDFSDNEKIARLSRKLTSEGNVPYDDPAAGDLCYYVPWGNIIFYYRSYRSSPDVIRIGRLDKGIAPLMTRGDFPMRVRTVESNG